MNYHYFTELEDFPGLQDVQRKYAGCLEAWLKEELGKEETQERGSLVATRILWA